MNLKRWAISALLLGVGVSACGTTEALTSTAPTTSQATASKVVYQSSPSSTASSAVESTTPSTSSQVPLTPSSLANSGGAQTPPATTSPVSASQSSQVAAVNNALSQIDSQINNLNNTQSAGNGDIANSSNGN